MSAGAAPRAALAAALACLVLGTQAASSLASPTPLVPINLSGAGQNAEEPQIAVDAKGDTVAVWSRSNGSHDIVQSASRPAGGAWSGAVDLSVAGRNATEPQVAVDGAGNAIAVWSRFDGSRTVIQSAVGAIGGSWSSPVDLSDSEWNAEAPQLAVGPAGEAVAVWSRYDGTHDIVQGASRPAAGSWSEAVDISVAGRNATEPQVAVDGAGKALAVWSRYDGADYIVQASARPPGGAWETPLDLSTTGESAEAPQVAIGPSGEAVAVWSRSDGADLIVQSAARAAGGSWSLPVDLSLTGRDADAPQVAIGLAGEAVAVWTRSETGFNSLVQSAVRSQGGPWSPAADLSAGGMIAEAPQVSVGSGDAVAVWASSDAAPSVIRSVTRPAGGAWGPPVGLSEIGRTSEEAQIAFAADGDGAGIWTRFDGTHTIVQAIGFDGAAPQLRSLSIPTVATAGQPVAFSVSPFDVWSAIASTRWSFGGEGDVGGTAATHVFPRPGAYGVTVTTTDAIGRVSTSSATVTVFPKSRAARNVRVKGRLAQLRVQCPGPAGCEGTAKLIAAVKVTRHGAPVKKRLPIGRARFSIPGSATTTVPIRLSRPALTALELAGRHGLKAQLTGPGIKHRVVALFGARR